MGTMSINEIKTTREMKQEDINTLLSDILNTSGFVNLDKTDIDNLKTGVDTLDAIKLSGKDEAIGNLLSVAISTLKDSNKDKTIKKLLFAIRLAKESNFMIEHISKVRDVLETASGDFDLVWGLSTNEDLECDNIELIVVVGLVSQNN